MEEESIRKSVSDILEQYNIQNIEEFSSEIDSFAFVEMVIGIEDAFGIVINPEELVMETFCNIEYIVEYLLSRLEEA